MAEQKSALIIGTEVAVSDYESGASHRIQAVRKILEDQGYVTKTVSRSEAQDHLMTKWDAVALVSFSTTKFSWKARKVTPFLWFDSTDSWGLTRRSLIRQGNYLQVFAYLRDLYFIWTAPRFDLVTFITARDRQTERSWWRWRAMPLVFPITGLDRNVRVSESKRLVFVGDGHYAPNQQALRFLGEMVSKLPMELPIHVFGLGYNSELSGCVFHGYSSAIELYEINDIHLAPIFSGAGLKLKVAIPVWNGLQVVTTPEGSNGFNELHQIAIGKTPDEFLKQIENFFMKPLVTQQMRLGHSIFEVDETQIIEQRIFELKIGKKFN
jgi:hypothetical protein